MVPNEEISLDEDELRRLLEQPMEEGPAPNAASAAPKELPVDGAGASFGADEAPAVTLGQDTIDQLLAQARGAIEEPPAAPIRREEVPAREEPLGSAATAALRREPERAPAAQQQPRQKPPVTVQPAQFAPLGGVAGRRDKSPLSDLGILLDVPLRITVELGRAEMPVRDILGLGPGSVVELDRSAGEVLDVLVNGTLIAQGEVVVVDEQFGIRLTHVYSPNKDILGGMGGQ